MVETFNEGLHSYEVFLSNELTCCLIDDIVSPQIVIHSCLSDGRNVISLRYRV